MTPLHEDIPDPSDVEFLLSEYVSGSLSARDARKLERRLREDAALREQLEQYVALEQELAGLSEEGPADVDYASQRTQIVRALERKALLDVPRRVPVIRRLFVPLAAAATLVMAATVAYVVLRPGSGLVAPSVLVSVVPPVAPDREAGTVMVELRGATPVVDAGVSTMRMRRMGWDEVRLTPPPSGDGLESALPPGTVMVSAGMRREEPLDLPIAFAGL